ncbi:MAG: Molybdenum transport ATP-binding protein ModC [Labilithrix sp.]|nr:Molybdenum transport ATP-binding protein ModC [Labilithrix sp.]
MTTHGPTLSVRAVMTSGAFTLDVAFDVPPGVTVLFGPSGAGKSRTLACIAGTAIPDAGRIAYGDEVWLEQDPARRRSVPIHARRVAYVFQSLALFPHLTAEENVRYGIARDLPKDERRARAGAMLTRMRVPHLAARRPGSFSGGEAQRVALARAFAMQPRVLLLDEPFSALDAAVKAALLEEVGAWVTEQRVPAILVTHQADEARALGSRVVLLAEGRVTAQGAIDDPALALPELRRGP